MITAKSRKREIRDLQRLLLSVGLMELTSEAEDGKWGLATQAGVLLAYARLGWDHPADGRWISAPALAAVASAMHQHTTDGDEAPTSGGIGGGGSHIGGGGSHIGGGGSHIGGGGSHIGGSGSHIGGDSTPE